VRNLIFDTTAIPASSNAVAVHWPSSQATTLSNVEFRLAAGAASKHIGLFIEEGSGGILTDLVFTGGWKAASLGNQQYTARAWTISNAQIAIEQLWDWGWTYQGLKISSCPVGIKIADANTGSITLLDSTFTSVTTAIQTGVDVPYAQYPAAGSLVIYNTVFASCATIVKSPTKVLLAGSASGSITVTGYVLVSDRRRRRRARRRMATSPHAPS
jgi:glucan 1,3-beta-glucosidase